MKIKRLKNKGKGVVAGIVMVLSGMFTMLLALNYIMFFLGFGSLAIGAVVSVKALEPTYIEIDQ